MIILYSLDPLYRLLHNLILIEFPRHLISAAYSHCFAFYTAHPGDLTHLTVQIIPVLCLTQKPALIIVYGFLTARNIAGDHRPSGCRCLQKYI